MPYMPWSWAAKSCHCWRNDTWKLKNWILGQEGWITWVDVARWEDWVETRATLRNSYSLSSSMVFCFSLISSRSRASCRWWASRWLSICSSRAFCKQCHPKLKASLPNTSSVSASTVLPSPVYPHTFTTHLHFVCILCVWLLVLQGHLMHGFWEKEGKTAYITPTSSRKNFTLWPELQARQGTSTQNWPTGMCFWIGQPHIM